MDYGTYLKTGEKLVRKRMELTLCGDEKKTILRQECSRMSADLGQMEREGLQSEQFWPLAYVLQLYDCSAFEKHIVWLLLCMETGVQFSERVTLETAAAAFEEPVQAAKLQLSENEIFCGLLAADCRDLKGEIRLDARFLHLFLTGEVRYAPYRHFLMMYDRSIRPVAIADEEGLLPQAMRLLCEEPDAGELVICGIYGEAGAGKRTFLQNLAAQAGREILLLTLDGWTTPEQVELWRRELFLWDAIPAVFQECRTETLEKSAILRQVVIGLPATGTVFWLTKERRLPELKKGIVLHFPPLQSSFQKTLHIWQETGKNYRLGENIPFSEISGKFCLTPGQIVRVYALAEQHRRRLGMERISSHLLHFACRELLEGAMGERAQKLTGKACLDDLVLPREPKRQLTDACNQARFYSRVYGEWGFIGTVAYGKGVSMLFSGVPGTGKTMAAQAVANELEMELYRVSLPAVVSKYIGETEKNLNEIFTQAKKSRVILFFDEADVLFSRRTEIKDSNDRYSNMEAAFLLQKMEEYEGVTILATNYLKNFDDAFRRRLHFIIDFPFPGAVERRQIWERTIPASFQTPELDIGFLSSRFELSGSNIRNIAVYAAFLAAAEDTKPGMRQFLAAVRAEYGKLGKTVTAEEFGEYRMFYEE